MVAFNFNYRFPQKIQAGQKHNTIRSKKRCKKGDKVQLYEGMRTKQCRLIGESTCTHVSAAKVSLRGIELKQGNSTRWMGADTPHCEEFSKSLGFDSFKDALYFYEEKQGLPFNGWCHGWIPLNNQNQSEEVK